MDHTTDGVTLFAVFISDVLRNYEDRKDDYSELFQIVEGVDLSDPFAKVPMSVYNELCQWIEDNLGKFNLIQVGRNVGETAYEAMVQNNLIPKEGATPLQVLEGIQLAAANMIQDPKKRGWEILEQGDHMVKMRRTQTFNSKLQLGLLGGLVRKTGATSVNVDYENSIEDGAEYDDYIITWM